MKRTCYILLFIFGVLFSGVAQTAFTFSGKLRLLEPTELSIVSIDGKEIVALKLKSNKEFQTKAQRIVPDVYILRIGETSQSVYLDNSAVSVKGFYNNSAPANSSLVFDGIDGHLHISQWLPTEPVASKRTIAPEVGEHLSGSQLSALAYIADMTQYEPNKMLLDLIPEADRQTPSVRWLRHRADSLGQFAVGALAYNFEYVDPEGKTVRLSDFRGKLVLVDFWASWCGPCRQEMKSLLPIYQDLKGDDLEFISVSLDKRESDWRRMLEEENLPWVMLWNSEGFTVGNEPNVIQKAYGFYGIPFIVLIGKDGRILARYIRGEKVKEAILEARELNL